MKNNLLKLKLLILLFFLKIIINNAYANEDKIIFKINNSSYTSIDYQIRTDYLNFIGENNKLQKDEILDDFISATLFFENYNNTKNKKIISDEEINAVYERIVNQNKKLKRKISNNLDKNQLIFHLKLDLIRKNILENYLNKRKNSILEKQQEIDLIYNFKINYINISKNYQSKKILNLNKVKFKTIEEVQEYLDSNKINYYKKNSEINDIGKINAEIRKNILKNIYFYKKETINSINFINIIKNFETLEGMIVNIYSLKTNNELQKKDLSCENLKKIKGDKINFFSKEYEYIKLNNEIKNNLLDINDYMIFKNVDEINYIMLCGIKFNEELLNNINLNKKIFTLVDQIEAQLVNEYKIKHNLILNNE